MQKAEGKRKRMQDAMSTRYEWGRKCVDPPSAFRFGVGKLIRKSAGVKLQRQPVRIRPQPPPLRSGVTGNTLGFDPRDSRFDPWLRSLRTWLNGFRRLSSKQVYAGSSPAVRSV